MNSNKGVKIIIISVVVLFLLLIVGAVVLMMLSNGNGTSFLKIGESNTVTDENSVSEENVVTETGDGESKITYVKTTDESEIPVPEGFKYVEGTVSTGAVIEDENGNQYVWVPTDETLFARRNFDTSSPTTTEGNAVNETTVSKTEFFETTESNSEYIESVNKYKGFYIGRYEASENPDDSEKACSKKGVLPWTEIVYDKIRRVAKNTYADNSSVMSDISSSYTWDTLCEWLSKSGYDIYNSTSYGNYANNTEGTRQKSQTGRNTKWVTNNIYDLAGNVWEITTEEWGDIYEQNHSGRGGGFHNDGVEYPISCRVAEYDGAYSYIGFRIVLYLK